MIRHVEMVEAIWSEIGERYAEGMSLDALAQRHHTTRWVITNGLKKRDLWVDGRKRKPQQERCVNGDDMSVYGQQMYKQMPDGSQVKNGRVCTGPACKQRKRERQRVSRSAGL